MRNDPHRAVIAISTPPGKGGVALLRLSGDGAFEIADRVFFPMNRKKLSECPLRTQIYGRVMREGEAIDDGMATRFAAPHSYTGEDTVEITCHGGVLLTRTVLEAFLFAGAAPAAAGEFTRRAFLNGKLSLTEAEAIGLLLDAKSHAQLTLTERGARGRLSDALLGIEGELTHLLSSIFARIDYPEEDLGEFSDEETAEKLRDILARVNSLLATYKTGRAVTEGISAVIAGKPNVGKSSLYNLLLGEDAAIVTDIPGTTRDVLERTVPLGRVLLRLYDTAGIRETDDPIERIGVCRSKEKIASADLIFLLFDTTRPLDEEDRALADAALASGATVLALATKSDLDAVWAPSALSESFPEVIPFSCKKGDLAPLAATVDRLFTDGTLNLSEDPVLFSARQYTTLAEVGKHLSLSLDAYTAGVPTDAASSDVEVALSYLSELTGKNVTEEIVQDIFSRFCVGK